MSKSDLDKFASESEKAAPPDLAKSISAGPTIWMLGSPSPASEGLVGLATSATQVVYVRREDVLDARQTAGRYLIRLAQGTNVLVREEQTIKLTVPNCRCQEPSKTIESKRTPGRTPPIVIDCRPTCWVELVPVLYRDPESGAVIEVMVPQIVCGNPCEGMPV